jgi:hypothetical protein
MAKNLLHCETGFVVYRFPQLGPFFLSLYLFVGRTLEKVVPSARKILNTVDKIGTIVKIY